MHLIIENHLSIANKDLTGSSGPLTAIRPHKQLLFVRMFTLNVPLIISTLSAATGQRRGHNADVYLICVSLGSLRAY